MSLGEEADRPGAEGKHPAPGEPTDLSKQEPAGEAPRIPTLPVIVSSDGSVTVDGAPVPLVPGEAVDVAILDTLHGYARSRDSPVRAAVSDPSADYVAIVQVEPDGSSRLVEQRHEGAAGYAAANGEAIGLPDPVVSRTPAPVPEPGRGAGGIGRRLLRQSDDEYQPPGFLKRPLGMGVVGVLAAAVVIVPLLLIGGSADGEAQNGAVGPDRKPSASPTPSALPSTAPPVGGAPPPPSPSPSTSAPAEPKPAPPPETGTDPDVPTGEVLIKNKKYGFCLDPLDLGEDATGGTVQDGACRSSGDNQRWVLDMVSKGGGTGQADLYLVRNAESGLCLDMDGDGPAVIASPVKLFRCDPDDEDNQLWWLDSRSGNTYWIRNQRSGDLCLDLSRTDKKAAHTDVTIFQCSDQDDHQWSFRK